MPSASYVWRQILNHIEQHRGTSIITTLFDDVEMIDLLSDTIVIYTPNFFRKPILEAQGTAYIQEAASDILRQNLKVKVLDEEGLKKYHARDNNPTGLDAIMKDFTFNNFVVGSSNQFAHAAAEAVSRQPGTVYNPLLIYGESGLGKTHLLYAIANEIQQSHPDFHIVYVKGDQFTNELVTALRDGKNQEFRLKYRTADLFLMDDIQFIAGKDSTQEEFFHTFNTLYEGRKQIVMTSDKPPESMSKLEDRLKTRFQWGLIADIQRPDYETRMAIIEKKAASLGLDLPRDVVEFIAENVTSNVRAIEGTVNKIIAYRNLSGFEINLTNVSRAIKDMFRNDEKILPTPNLIISEVAAFYNIQESAITGVGKTKALVEARQISMYLIRTMTNLSLEDIALSYGKDHTTVMHSVNKITQSLRTSEHVKTVVEEISANINGKLS